MSVLNHKVVENFIEDRVQPLPVKRTQEEIDEAEYQVREHLPLTHSEAKTKELYSQFYHKHGRDFDPQLDSSII